MKLSEEQAIQVIDASELTVKSLLVRLVRSGELTTVQALTIDAAMRYAAHRNQNAQFAINYGCVAAETVKQLVP